MNHRWIKPALFRKFQWPPIRPVPEPARSIQDYAIEVRQHCVKCGGVAYAFGVGKPGRIRTRHFFRKMDGIYHEVRYMPPCEGLPAGYQAPEGA